MKTILTFILLLLMVACNRPITNNNIEYKVKIDTSISVWQGNKKLQLLFTVQPDDSFTNMFVLVADVGKIDNLNCIECDTIYMINEKTARVYFDMSVIGKINHKGIVEFDLNDKRYKIPFEYKY